MALRKKKSHSFSFLKWLNDTKLHCLHSHLTSTLRMRKKKQNRKDHNKSFSSFTMMIIRILAGIYVKYCVLSTKHLRVESKNEVDEEKKTFHQLIANEFCEGWTTSMGIRWKVNRRHETNTWKWTKHFEYRIETLKKVFWLLNVKFFSNNCPPYLL